MYCGYANDVAQSVPFGDQDQVAPGLGHQGQPVVFEVGTYPRVFSAVRAHVFDGVSSVTVTTTCASPRPWA